jgi:hypothetical protein
MARRRLLGALLATGLILLPACAEEPETTKSGGDGPTITIVSPADGTDVESPVELQLSVTRAEIGPTDTGLMHFHVYVGGASDYKVVTNTSGSIDLPEGEQTVRVVLAQPNHDETDVSAEVTVNVTSGTTGGGGGYGAGVGYGH